MLIFEKLALVSGVLVQRSRHRAVRWKSVPLINIAPSRPGARRCRRAVTKVLWAGKAFDSWRRKLRGTRVIGRLSLR